MLLCLLNFIYKIKGDKYVDKSIKNGIGIRILVKISSREFEVCAVRILKIWIDVQRKPPHMSIQSTQKMEYCLQTHTLWRQKKQRVAVSKRTTL